VRISSSNAWAVAMYVLGRLETRIKRSAKADFPELAPPIMRDNFGNFCDMAILKVIQFFI